MLGFGSIGSGLMPLLFEHFGDPRVRVVTSDDRNLDIAREYGVEHRVEPITESNYARILQENVSPGDFLVNLTVDVDSLDVIKWCAGFVGAVHRHRHRALGRRTTRTSGFRLYERSNSFLRQRVIDHRDGAGQGPTAIIAHGANPGLVNPLRQGRAAPDRRRDTASTRSHRSREDWIALAHRLGIKVIHIAERDTQVATSRRSRASSSTPGRSTASSREGSQPAELGWGTHEKAIFRRRPRATNSAAAPRSTCDRPGSR